LYLLETDNLMLRYRLQQRITVIEFGVNDGGGNGASCGGIEVRTDTNEAVQYGNSKLWIWPKVGKRK